MDSSLIFSQYSADESLQALDSNRQSGLKNKEIAHRQLRFGANELVLNQVTSYWEILLNQLKSIIVLLLIIAGVISFVMGHTIEAVTVVIVLLINTTIGFMTELKATRSMEALKKIGITSTKVLRDGKISLVNAVDLVPGDIVMYEAGDLITADTRIIDASKLSVDESILTGESVPVDKNSNVLKEPKVLGERINILFRGTSLTKGTSVGVVFATGMETEIGKIVTITEFSNEELTPLERRLEQLGKQLVIVSVFIAFIIALFGVMSGKNLLLMIETAMALSVATIPEGLPIVATLALAKGMWKMAKENALIKKLSSVETLGATTIIFTDKTGTLTKNKMTVRSFYTSEGVFDLQNTETKQLDQQLKDCVTIGVLCNNSTFHAEEEKKFVGDPMEVALMEVGRAIGFDIRKIQEDNPEEKEVAFDSETLMMATYHQSKTSKWVAVKGAPEVVIDHCVFIQHNKKINSLTPEDKNTWKINNQQMALDGLRVLGLARKNVNSKDEDPYENLVFVGLVGLIDPARKDIKFSIEKCKNAGIKTIMLTGDQEGTAKKIARDIALIEDLHSPVIHGSELSTPDLWSQELKEKVLAAKVFCRVSPEQKYLLVDYLQNQNHVVAMTGDGVNDAPALKKADIGIAMGVRGTQVAKEAADMVLQDDQFKTIVSAIKQGRIIYSNIQRFVIYLLSCNISEIFVISFAALVNKPLPLMPLQILFLNLVTDVFPALALGMGEGDETYLTISPRKRDDDIISKRKWMLIIVYGLIITICVLLAFFTTLHFSDNYKIAVTVSFLTIGLAQVLHVFSMRLSHTSFYLNDITRNRYVWAAVFLCVALLVMSVKWELSRSVLNLVDIGWEYWRIVILLSLTPVVFIYFLSKSKLGLRL